MFAKAIVALATATAAFFPAAYGQTVVEVAAGDDRFETLVAAVTAAGLVEALSGDGPFTVFAPTDDAFMNVNVTMLLEDQWRAHLESVLLYHVLGSEVRSSDLELDAMVETLEGSNITVTSLDPPQVDFAEIIIPDINAENGVVHVIDDVLLPPSMTESIVDVAIATPTLSQLVELVVAAGLDGVLDGEGPFTVFAPTNDAFAEVPEETLAALAADPEGALTDVLLYHVVPGIVLAEDLSDGDTPATVQGSTVDVSIDGDTVMINDATVVLADVLANNGVVHVIDKVLLPPPPTGGPPPPVAADEAEPEGTSEEVTATIVDLAVGDDAFETLVAALGAADLVGALQGEGPFTVFAPIDGAFRNDEIPVDKLLEPQWRAHLTGILLYHVVEGIIMSTDLELDATATTLEGSDVTVTSVDPPMINQAEVVVADLEAANGVVHAINSVLLPPFATTNIVETAVSLPDTFSTLVAAVTAADLAEALSGDGPFTVFAPTNEAFAALGDETIEALLAEPEGALTDILLYHVVSGIVLADDLEVGLKAPTLNGAAVEVTSLDPPMINDATVVIPDVLASNGVIHVIDTVLLPPDAPEERPADSPYKLIKSKDYDGDACIEVKDGVVTNGQRVILGDCTASGGGWRIDGRGMIHTELDDDFCLQAGYGGHSYHDMLGRPLRIAHCSRHERLQRWEHDNCEELTPKVEDDLCVVWRGTTANIGLDPMILLDCDHAKGRRNWCLH